MSEARPVQELEAEIVRLRDALARIAVAQVEALNAMADYLGTQGGGALGILPPGMDSVRAARAARGKLMEAARNTIEVASEVISTDAG